MANWEASIVPVDLVRLCLYGYLIAQLSPRRPIRVQSWYTNSSRLMARNSIQFHKGLSLLEFQQLYGT